MSNDAISVSEASTQLAETREREPEPAPDRYQDAGLARPSQPREGKIYGSDESEFRRAARELADSRKSTEDETIEAVRKGRHIDPIEVNADRAVELAHDRDERGIDARKVAADLAEYRRGRDAMLAQGVPSQPTDDDAAAAGLAEADADAGRRAAERANDPEIARRENELSAERAAVAEARTAAEALRAHTTDA